MAYGDAARMDERGTPITGNFIEHVGAVHSPPEGDIYEMLLAQNFIPAMATLIRRECFATVGPYDESLVYEDWDMWLRIARHYEFAFTPGVQVRYRVHSASLSQRLASERWWSTDMSIFLKHIGHSAAWDAILWDRIARAAYRLDRQEQLEYARANLRAGRTLPALVLYGLCRAGVPYRRVAPLKHAVDGIGVRYAGRSGDSPDRDLVVADDLRHRDRGIAGDESAFRHVAAHDGSRCDHGVGADRDLGVDDRAGADEGPAAERHIAAEVAAGAKSGIVVESGVMADNRSPAHPDEPADGRTGTDQRSCADEAALPHDRGRCDADGGVDDRDERAKAARERFALDAPAMPRSDEGEHHREQCPVGRDLVRADDRGEPLRSIVRLDVRDAAADAVVQPGGATRAPRRRAASRLRTARTPRR